MIPFSQIPVGGYFRFGDGRVPSGRVYTKISPGWYRITRVIGGQLAGDILVFPYEPDFAI